MGLRTASVRRPYVEVMAPALTETSQNQPAAFQLETKTNGSHHKYLPDVPGGAGAAYYTKVDVPMSDGDANLNTLALLASDRCCSDLNSRGASASSADTQDIIMSDTAVDTMGLEKTTGADAVGKLGEKPPSTTNNDVDQIIINLASNLPANDDEDWMQVFNERLTSSQPHDLSIENVEDLPTNLTIDKFFNDVDMMNISMEDQADVDHNKQKELKSNELIAEYKKRQAKIERRLDFLRRKLHKFQARSMGQHASAEVAGVYEYVHRSLKRLKENNVQTFENNPPEPADSDKKPISYSSTKALLKKLEMAVACQANALARQKHVPKYFGSGSTDLSNNRLTMPGISNVPMWPSEHKQELQNVSGLLQAELSVVQHEVDSEATESSSGGESCDEMQTYNNPHQQYLSIQKRALWKYAKARAAIAARWTWLQAQISDLEYRIRQHSDLNRQIRAAKGQVRLGGASPPPLVNNVLNATSSPNAVNGYRGQLPGSTTKEETAESDSAASTQANGAFADYQCARCRPLVGLKKRRLLQINGLHIISKKAARPSTLRCDCTPDTGVSCALCTGRTDPTYPRDPLDSMSKTERIALIDPGYHPVFSMPEDVSYGLHCDAIMKTSDWQQRSMRMKSLKVLKNDRPEKVTSLEHRAKKLDQRNKKYNRLLKPSTASALSAKIRSKIRGRKQSRHSTSSSSSLKKRTIPRTGASGAANNPLISGLPGEEIDDELDQIGSNSNPGASDSLLASPSSSPLLQMQSISGFNRRSRADSYDIDNIVIPYSVAASTRVEKLQYKEILTPKWRIAEPDFKCDTKNNGAVIRNPSQDSDAEDLSEDAVVVRHDKSEYDEKKKFLSYLKLPMYHRSRSHKRTDSLAESSGGNTPDPLSPHPPDLQDNNANNSPMTSPPATPLPAVDETMPSISAMRRRTISQSRFVRDREVPREENNTPENVEVLPFDTRTFPLDNDTYDKMVRSMPENYLFKTNSRAQDSSSSCYDTMEYLNDKVDSPGSESTESAIGEEDPNDPEWVDMELKSRDRHRR